VTLAAPESPPAVDPEEPRDILLVHLGSSRDGLSPREAERRLSQFGPNLIERAEGASALRRLAAQFTHPLALLLWVAAALAFGTGSAPLAAAIVVVIVLNAAFAFAQEQQAERATEALAAFLPPSATVLRDGERVELLATQLVPGDVLLLEEGDRLSADARLIAGSLELDVAPLTGESQPVSRSASRAAPAASRLEAEDLVFAGTLCTAGEAKAVVFATGMATELGRIAALSQRVQPEISPLQRQVNRAAQLIAAVAVGAGVVFFAAGTLFTGLSIGDAATFAIGLLVANVPEGLLPTITLALAVGVRRMARRKALVKRLTAVETLGSTDVICTDKTGTLTEGRMVTTELWTDGATVAATDRTGLAAPAFSAILHVAVRCANARIATGPNGFDRTGDPSESALLVSAADAGVDVLGAQAGRERTRVALAHFDSRRKRMSTVDAEEDGRWLHTKGAPLELLERCTAMLDAGGGERPLDAVTRERVRAAFEADAGRGLRVLGFARRRVAQGEDLEVPDALERGLTFLGLAALSDPARADVADAVARCRAAGIRIVLITGDHGLTAEAIAREVGIVTGTPRISTGPEIDAMPDGDLDALLSDPRELIVARSSPETKLRIVDALRANGRTVAMTGDGGQRRTRVATRRHRGGDGRERHGRRPRGRDDGAYGRQLRVDRRRGVGRPRRLREHPQVHRLHLRPRHPRGRAVPHLRALGRSRSAAAHRAADPGDRPRHRDAPGARARARAGRARCDGPPATAARIGDPDPFDARPRLAVARPARGCARDGRLLLGPPERGLVSG
jgi:magnesium-transporting ATPase (P-type)